MKKSLFTSFLLMLCFFSSDSFGADIGLKVSAQKNWLNWGDYILGQDFKKGFEDLGYEVEDAYMDNYYPSSLESTKVDVYMHGFVPFNPKRTENKQNVLYLYYPLETAHMEKYKNISGAVEPDWYSLETELWNFDLVAVASKSYQDAIEKYGIKTVFVPQFTNAQKFFYEYDESVAYDILFVGRPGYERLSAKWAIESGFDVALFGDGWQDKAPLEYFKGEYIDNNELHKYYASAKIVLNDTREDMKKAGFISNRVFDVTASGGFLISDYMPEIEEFYGDSIPMFKTKEELKELIEYYLNHPKERALKAKQAQEITLREFTNTVAAERILTTLSTLQPSPQAKMDENKLIIKSPWGENATNVGDYWLGLDIEQGLKDNGFEVKNYYYDGGFFRDSFYDEAANLLYLQFKYNRTDFEDDDKARIMYLYFPTFVPDLGKFDNSKDELQYNTDVYLNNELLYFDQIATPAKAVFEELKARGYPAEFVPQFANPQKFYYEPDDALKTDLLFVGSTWYDRVSALYAAELNYDVAIYGFNWKGKVDDKFIKGEFIDNRDLHKYYSSAKIVLSDHAEDLSQMGLVINRLYDATAVGAFVISEYSPYIEEIFGDSIPLFKNKEEFKTLVDFYLAHPEERTLKAKQAQEITLNGYTNKIIGQKLKQLFYDIREAKK